LRRVWRSGVCRTLPDATDIAIATTHPNNIVRRNNQKMILHPPKMRRMDTGVLFHEVMASLLRIICCIIITLPMVIR
jgi:hypothetical protein